MLPNFLVIGAWKAGTTSLYYYLREHPQVFMSARKELNFFVGELNWQRGRPWYESQFQDARGAVAVGEVSPRYTAYPQHKGVPERIAEVLPGIRLIYVVRDPIDRMRSHYLQRIPGGERRPVEEALFDRRTYVDFSLYAMQIERYLAHFSRDQLLVVVAERLRDQRRRTLDRICEFLGLSGGVPLTSLDREFNRAIDPRASTRLAKGLQKVPGYRPLSRVTPGFVKRTLLPHLVWAPDPQLASISPEFRRRLADLFTDDVRRLRAYVDDESFDGWGIA